MTIYRSKRLFIFGILSVCVLSFSIGFAAFSATLNISSSASVTPDSSDFSVEFLQNITSAYKTHDGGLDGITPTTSGGATGSEIEVSGTSVRGLKANFTAPGQSVLYDFYIANTGMYDAYLKEIKFSNVSGKDSNVVCTASDDATSSLVEAACNGIYIEFSIDEDMYFATTSNISNKILYKETYLPVKVKIIYGSNSARADGDFTVEFGDIDITYSSVIHSNNLISFRSYNSGILYAEEGMTWGEWVNSKYNTIGAYVDCYNQLIFDKDKSYIIYDNEAMGFVYPNYVLKDGHVYGDEEYLSEFYICP